MLYVNGITCLLLMKHVSVWFNNDGDRVWEVSYQFASILKCYACMGVQVASFAYLYFSRNYWEYIANTTDDGILWSPNLATT